MGAEKFFDIKCRASGLRCDAAVIVATVRALKMHGGVGRIVAGKPLDPALLENNPEGVRARRRQPRQADRERPRVRRAGRGRDQHLPDRHAPRRSPAIHEVALAAGARDAVEARHFTDGGAGAEDLARAVWAAAEEGSPDFRLLYPDEMPLREKIETIATRIYGADGVDYSPAAAKSLKLYEELGYGNLPGVHGQDPVQPLATTPSCWAAPTGFRVPIREVRLSAGAGFVTPILRRHAHDAGPQLPPGRRADRHRRRRERRRAVLAAARPEVASLGRDSCGPP